MFIEALGKCIKGTVLCLVADNLAAHALAGFVKSFKAGHVCRWCVATTSLIQSHEVADGTFNMRTMTSHDLNVQNVLCGDGTPECGVKADCVF